MSEDCVGLETSLSWEQNVWMSIWWMRVSVEDKGMGFRWKFGVVRNGTGERGEEGVLSVGVRWIGGRSRYCEESNVDGSMNVL